MQRLRNKRRISAVNFASSSGDTSAPFDNRSRLERQESLSVDSDDQKNCSIEAVPLADLLLVAGMSPWQGLDVLEPIARKRFESFAIWLPRGGILTKRGEGYIYF